MSTRPSDDHPTPPPPDDLEQEAVELARRVTRRLSERGIPPAPGGSAAHSTGTGDDPPPARELA